MTVTYLIHSKVRLALHELRAGSGRPLLLLHGLGERSPDQVPAELAVWPGGVYGLDFTGHGESSVPAGGGYTAEFLMADVDAALAHLGDVTVMGRGLGAYVGLLVAGARARVVRGAILRDGPGMYGGGPRPGSPFVARADPRAVSPPDPLALAELAFDVRPSDYATTFARMAAEHSGLDEPVAVCARARPDWLQAVCLEPGIVETTLSDALRMFGPGVRGSSTAEAAR